MSNVIHPLNNKREKFYKSWTMVTGLIVWALLVCGAIGLFYPIFSMSPGTPFPQVGRDTYYHATWTQVYYHTSSATEWVQKHKIPGLTPYNTIIVADTFAINKDDGSVYFWWEKLDAHADDLHVVTESEVGRRDAGLILYAYDNDYVYSRGWVIAEREEWVDPYDVYLQYLDHTLPDFRG